MEPHPSLPSVFIPDALVKKAGPLPLRCGTVRFAVGSPDGLTSNSWRIWTTRHRDIYIACRDNFKEAKVSLHTSGRWRMGFTTEAVAGNPALTANDQDRAWEVWDEPPQSLPDTVVAFRLLFPTSELAVRPEQRSPKDWKEVIFLEPAPPGKLSIATLFVTSGDRILRHESEPSLCLAALKVDEDRSVQIVVHTDREGDFRQFLDNNVARARAMAKAAGVEIPSNAYGYFFGNRTDESRFLVGACIGSR